MLDIAHGDVALSKHLKNSLNLLRDKVDDPEFKKLVDEVVSGRRSLRDTFASPAFSHALNPLMDRAMEYYQNLSEGDREELTRTGEQQFDRMRKEQEQSPKARGSELEEDMDEDFSDRSWLR